MQRNNIIIDLEQDNLNAQHQPQFITYGTFAAPQMGFGLNLPLANTPKRRTRKIDQRHSFILELPANQNIDITETFIMAYNDFSNSILTEDQTHRILMVRFDDSEVYIKHRSLLRSAQNSRKQKESAPQEDTFYVANHKYQIIIHVSGCYTALKAANNYFMTQSILLPETVTTKMQNFISECLNNRIKGRPNAENDINKLEKLSDYLEFTEAELDIEANLENRAEEQVTPSFYATNMTTFPADSSKTVSAKHSLSDDEDNANQTTTTMTKRLKTD